MINLFSHPGSSSARWIGAVVAVCRLPADRDRRPARADNGSQRPPVYVTGNAPSSSPSGKMLNHSIPSCFGLGTRYRRSISFTQSPDAVTSSLLVAPHSQGVRDAGRRERRRRNPHAVDPRSSTEKIDGVALTLSDEKTPTRSCQTAPRELRKR